MPRKNAPIGEEFLVLRHRLAEWWKDHSRRTPLPDEIWTGAVELARRHGVYRTARALPIDYVNLRKRLNLAAAPTSLTRPKFVELLMPPAEPAACVEVLRIPVNGALDFHQLFRAQRWTMIQITPQMRVLVAVDPVDLRKGIDGLAAVCREKLQADPFSGWLFIFRSRRATAIRLLVYDGRGFWMAHKRLSKGRFFWWPTAETAAKTGLVPKTETTS